MVKRAFLSVYDKTDIDKLAQALVNSGHELISSGGTARAIADAGFDVTDVVEITGYPAILGHRVVTLHPKVHGGILADKNDPDHQADLKEYEIELFDIVVGGLYPFWEEPSIEKIDIGGSALIRGAAKNHDRVTVITNIGQYEDIIDLLSKHGEIPADTRKQLATDAFSHSVVYDMAIAEWMSGGDYTGLWGHKTHDCDYGENRWQSPAALYRNLRGESNPLALDQFKILKGRSPSYINWTDVDRLLMYLTFISTSVTTNNQYQKPHIAIAVKHGNVCGAGIGRTPDDAIKQMVTGNKRAVFGAVMVANFRFTQKLAELMYRHDSEVRRLFDGVCAPSYTDGALNAFGRRDGKFFVGQNPSLGDINLDSVPTDDIIRPVFGGGFLKQPAQQFNGALGSQVQALLDGQQSLDLSLGLAVCGVTTSNTVTLVKDGMVIGNGAGQQDRVGACELAIKMARQNGHDIIGAIAVSDSFFPATDGPQALINAGVDVIFSTSGSRADEDVQTLCNKQGVTLVQIPDADARMFFGH